MAMSDTFGAEVLWSITLSDDEMTLKRARDIGLAWINQNGSRYRREITAFYAGAVRNMIVTPLDIFFDPINRTVMVVHDKDAENGNV